MLCPKCKNPIDDNSTVCEWCGANCVSKETQNFTAKKEDMKTLWNSVIKNIVIAVLLTATLMLAMKLLNIKIYFDKVLILSILATIFGVAYLLTIRNPQNYLGFYLGIGSSVCLGLQFAFLGGYDLTFLYFAVFIPFQSAAIVNWQKKSLQNSENEEFNPKFLPFKRQIVFFLFFLTIIIIDYIFASFILPFFKEKPFFTDFFIKIIFATMISSSILANYLMISKWFDTWIYWLLYSISAIFSAIIIKNDFNLLLFAFFLIINTISFISWLKIKRS